MMAERKAEVLVGFTVALALLILVLGVIWGKGVEFLARHAFLTVRFEDVRGLEKSDPVLVRGIRQGRVEKVVLRNEFAEVRLRIREDVPLYSDLRITVEDRELMGGKQVAIDPGKSGRSVDLRGVFYGETRGDVRMVLVRAEDVLSRADSVFLQIETFLEEGRLSRVLQNVEETTDQAKKILAENRRNFRLTVERLEKLMRGLQEDSTAVRLGVVVTELDSTICLMKRVVLQMENEDGTLGKLIHDRWLYDQLLKTSVNLDSLIDDIRANPKRYFHVSVF